MTTFCEVCGMGDMVEGEDSTLYCQNCGAQSTHFIEDAMDADDIHMYTAVFKRDMRVGREEDQQNLRSSPRKGHGEARDDPQDQQILARLTLTEDRGPARSRMDADVFLPASQLGQGSYPTERIPNDLLASMIRSSYVTGIQKILQLQCEALVKQFGVSPLICGIMGPIWLKYVASTRVFEKVWAEEAIEVAEHRERIRKGNPRRVFKEATRSREDVKMRGKKPRKKPRKRKGGPELRTSFGRQSRFVWLSALKERIPLSITLALSYLCCYIAREPVLPTDIIRWASDGELPYLTAFMEISNGGGQSFPIAPALMFRPGNMVGSRGLELQAGFVAERVAVQLPPVNFHAISALFLRDLGLPIVQLSAYVCRLYEWYTPSGLWLSAREAALPTRVYAMSMLIITIKILYKLDGRTLPQGGKIGTQRSRRLLGSTEKGKNGHLQSLNRRATRAMAMGEAAVEACEGEQQRDNTPKIIEGMEAGGTNDSKEHLISAPTVQTLGKRKRLPTVSNGRDGRSQSGGEDKQILREASSGLPDTNARLQEEQTELGDAKELVEILESKKAKNTMSEFCGFFCRNLSANISVPRCYDERLSRYLKYCRDVVFTGYDCDGGVEAIMENCWEIYEQTMSEVTSKPAADSVEKEVAGTSKTGKVADGPHVVAGDNLDDNAEGIYPTFGQDSRKKLRLQPGTHGSLESAESFSRDAPLSSILRTGRNSTPEPSKQKQQKRENEVVLHQCGTGDAGMEDLKSIPARDVDRGYKKKRDSSSLITKMKNAGFACLPPLTNSVASDVYMRYNFQVSHGRLVSVHEDYFKVLQACGKLIQTDAMALHHCVQILEKGLLQIETSVETFNLGQDGNVATLADAIRRRKPPRRRDKKAEAQNVQAAAERIAHLVDLSYL